MIDIDIINQLISDRRTFRIEGRGICINCYPKYQSGTEYWYLEVPRASLEMVCDTISICDDVNFTVMECHNHDDKDCTGVFDLKEYTKITRLY